MSEKTCFVVQGFGPKTDYTDGRVLNLDASYEVIKQAVLEAGLRCIRADEIVHSGTIDIPMYEQLLHADLVIADLSTYNVNAVFELGVRYGLRPHATIVLAEEQFKSPFDVNHIVIRRYKHLGEDIGMREALRFKEELKGVIASILDQARTDSPVYAMLAGLRPPREEQERDSPPSAPASSDAATEAPRSVPIAPAAAAAGDARGDTDAPVSARVLLERAQDAMKRDDFVAAKAAWTQLRRLNPTDIRATQQLALATYKARQPSPEAALADARDLLLGLAPATTNDPETLGLWGAVHKRLWDLHHDANNLSEAVLAYERGYSVKQDHYNGINLAFLLNLRAVDSARKGERDEAIADNVLAARVRRDLIRFAMPLAESPDLSDEKRYWVVASLWEAALGLDDASGVAHWEAQARNLNVPAWMQKTREEQGQRLLALKQELATLLAAAPAAKPA
jgi:tetratricopeptide (TPR) repeat protein